MQHQHLVDLQDLHLTAAASETQGLGVAETRRPALARGVLVPKTIVS